MTVSLPERYLHSTRAMFTALVSCNDEIAVHSCSLLFLQRQVAKLARDCSTLGLYCVKITRHKIFKGSLQVVVVARVARWCQIWQILPKVTIFQKICRLFWQYFYDKFLPFFEIPIASVGKTIHFELFIQLNINHCESSTNAPDNMSEHDYCLKNSSYHCSGTFHSQPILTAHLFYDSLAAIVFHVLLYFGLCACIAGLRKTRPAGHVTSRSFFCSLRVLSRLQKILKKHVLHINNHLSRISSKLQLNKIEWTFVAQWKFMLINLTLRPFRVVQAWFKAMILYVIIKLKFYFRFLTINQTESFRSKESETDLKKQLSSVATSPVVLVLRWLCDSPRTGYARRTTSLYMRGASNQ